MQRSFYLFNVILLNFVCYNRDLTHMHGYGSMKKWLAPINAPLTT